MLPLTKTTTGIALLLSLSACASTPTKDKTPPPAQNFIAPSATSEKLKIRAEADYQFVLGDVLSREGNSAKAVEHFEKVATLDPAPAVYLRLSAEYQKLNRTKEAILNAEKAVAKDPQNIEAHFILGSLYSADEAYDLAITQYNVILHMQPKNTNAIIYLGSLYGNKKDFKKAEHYFNILLKDAKYDSPYLIHYYLGLMYSDQKGYELAAENAFNRSLKLKPEFEDALTSLANLYLQQKKSHKALALCLSFQKQEGFRRSVADLITQIHIDNGDLDKAYEQLDFISSHSESSLESQMKMALILIKSKHISQATVKLNEILAKYPDADSARYYLAATYEESGDADKAIHNYMLIPPSSEHSSEAIAHAAYLLKGEGKINQALALTTQELKTKADPQVYIMHASLLDAKADYLGAARSLENALKKYSQNTELLFQHAIMLDRLGKKDAMIAQMKKVLEIAPDHVQSMSYLAFTLAEQNQNLSEAEKLARHASELAPRDGYVLDTLGWVLFKQKKFSESIQVLERAYAYQPSASIIAEHLADAYSMQSQSEKAKEMYKKATGLTTDEFRAHEIRIKLAKLNS
ncbi:MAG: tetratricopeptide repeat protein [Bacillota bacterium]